ncbi:MAG: glycosyltransferase [Dongiaceae bacterium]
MRAGGPARRILLAATVEHLPEATGGVESTTHELALALRALGREPAVLARTRAAGRGRAVDRDLGYAVHRARRPLAALPGLLRSWRPDAALVQLGRIVPLAARLLEAGVPTLVYLHNLERASWGGPLIEDPRLAYLTNSGFMAERLAPLIGHRPLTVPPLIDRERYRTEPEGRCVTFVNPLPAKGLEIALGLAAARPDIPFELVESWPLRPAEEARLAAALAALPNVVLTRRVADMRPVYRRSRLLLAPSRWIESWGRVASEAQVSGLPVLASRSGGLPEAVGPGGILLPPEAPLADWLAALARLWDDEGAYRRLAAAARRHAARPGIQPARVLADLVAAIDGHRRRLGRPAALAERGARAIS